MNLKYEKGFTVSEVLVAVAIIGVVAALVVPAMINNFAKSGFESLLGSFYNDLSQSITLANTEKGAYLSRTSLATNTGAKLLKTYMQVKLEPNCSADEPCFANTYESIDGTVTKSISEACSETFTQVMINNGAAVCINAMTTDASKIKDNYSVIYVDTNGPDEPNIGGKDMFVFNLYSDGSIDEQAPPSTRLTVDRDAVAEKCISSAFGEGCFTQFMRDNMKINYY